MSWCLGDTYPKARREHRCDLCAYPIPKGMQHVARAVVGEGRVTTFRMHMACESVTKSWDDEDWEYTQPWSFVIIPEFVNHPDHPTITGSLEARRGE